MPLAALSRLALFGCQLKTLAPFICVQQTFCYPLSLLDTAFVDDPLKVEYDALRLAFTCSGFGYAFD